MSNSVPVATAARSRNSSARPVPRSSVVIAWDLVLFQLTHRLSMAMLTATQYTLELLGFVLLFHPASTRWYRRKRSAPSSMADPGAAPRG